MRDEDALRVAADALLSVAHPEEGLPPSLAPLSRELAGGVGVDALEGMACGIAAVGAALSHGGPGHIDVAALCSCAARLGRGRALYRAWLRDREEEAMASLRKWADAFGTGADDGGE